MSPLPIRLSVYFQVFNQPRATYEALKAFRPAYMNVPISLVSDGGGDFSKIAEHFGCSYTFDKEPVFVGARPNMGLPTDEHRTRWFNRLLDACKPDTDWLLLLEDDVLTRGPIKHFPPAPMAGPCFCCFTDALKLSLLERHKDLAIFGYSGCGGTILSIPALRKAIDNRPDFDAAGKLDSRVALHSDAMLTYLFLYNGFENKPWLDFSETCCGIGLPDAAFEHQYKRWYGARWEDRMIGAEEKYGIPSLPNSPQERDIRLIGLEVYMRLLEARIVGLEKANAH